MNPFHGQMSDSGWEPYYDVLKLYYKICLSFIEIDALGVYKYRKTMEAWKVISYTLDS